KTNAFDVRSGHAVSIEEYKASVAKKVDTCIPNPAPELELAEKTEVLFQRSEPEYTVTYETYGDAELYADTELDAVSEEYTEDTPKYGSIHPLERFDFGEPGKEVVGDEERSDAARSVIPEPCYIPPEEIPERIEDLEAEDVTALIEVTEHYAEAVAADLSNWQDAEDFGFEIEDML
ncbi:MAG: hypothetical protein IKN55_06445, partial [Oscillospiraceae bacterium]|nr:hypothetical protein [Oscillospiraceae bacterium]